MNHAGLDLPKRRELWTEAAATATKLSNILVDNKDDKHAYEKFFGTKTKYEHHLRIFGEIGVMTKHNQKIKDKLSDRGIKCMFVGYAKDHDGDVYRMLDYKTGTIYLTRDVTWTTTTYSEETQTTPCFVDIEWEDEDSVSENRNEEEEIVFEMDDEAPEQDSGRDKTATNDNKEPIPTTNEGEELPSFRLSRELKGLADYNNPGLKERANFCFLIGSKVKSFINNKDELTIFQKAW